MGIFNPENLTLRAIDSIMVASTAQRSFLVTARACTGPNTLQGYGLLKLSWDAPAAGWQWAVQDPLWGSTSGLLAYDDVNRDATAIWSMINQDPSTCKAATNMSRSNLDIRWTWP